MKELWNWLVKNFSDLFTIIGIVLTVYFSIFYVPEYIKENLNEKINNINSDLIESIQEVVYNHYQLDQKQIEALIRGKEIKFRIDYPYTPNELLIQTQETFMANKFIPLNERVNVVNRIDSIRVNLKTEIPETNEQKADSFLAIDRGDLTAITISVLLLSISMIGFISFLTKLSRERKDKINKEVELEKDDIETRIVQGMNFEKSIQDILLKNKLNFSKIAGPNKSGYDFMVKLNSVDRLPISVKYLNSSGSLDMSSIDRLFSPFIKINQRGVVIINKDDKRIIQYLNKFSENLKGKLHLIVSDKLEIIESDLMIYINDYRQKDS
jgi:hypothetical protein